VATQIKYATIILDCKIKFYKGQKVEAKIVEELKNEIVNEETTADETAETEETVETAERELTPEEAVKDRFDSLSELQKSQVRFVVKKLLNKNYTMLMFLNGKAFNNKLRLPTGYPELIPDDIFEHICEAFATIFEEDAPVAFALKKKEGSDVDVLGFGMDENGRFVFMSSDEAEEAFKFNRGSMNVNFVDFSF
jgi:hypothetical protein